MVFIKEFTLGVSYFCTTIGSRGWKLYRTIAFTHEDYALFEKISRPNFRIHWIK